MKCDTIRSFAAQILSGAKDHRGGERVEMWETVTGRRVVFVVGDGRQVKQRSFAALRMTGKDLSVMRKCHLHLNLALTN